MASKRMHKASPGGVRIFPGKDPTRVYAYCRWCNEVIWVRFRTGEHWVHAKTKSTVCPTK